MRTWQLFIWDGKKYVKPTSDGTITANGPDDAMKKFGLTDPSYTIKYSRKGYGYFTGRVEYRSPETMAAGKDMPLPADFVIKVID